MTAEYAEYGEGKAERGKQKAESRKRKGESVKRKGKAERGKQRCRGLEAGGGWRGVQMGGRRGRFVYVLVWGRIAPFGEERIGNG
jgi:hypothetical protein